MTSSRRIAILAALRHIVMGCCVLALILPGHPALGQQVKSSATPFSQVGPGALRIAAKGTGRTTGHIADLSITNPTDQTMHIEIGECFIPARNREQGYVVPGVVEVLVPPLSQVTMPLEGYCVNVDRPPVSAGVAMTPVNRWVRWEDGAPIPSPGVTLGSPFRPAVQPTAGYVLPWPGGDIPFSWVLDVNSHPTQAVRLLLHFTGAATAAVDKLLAQGQLQLNGRSRESFIQQALWLQVSRLEGKNYDRASFQQLYADEWRQTHNNPAPTPPSHVVMEADDLWGKISLVGAEAKILPGALPPSQNRFVPQPAGDPIDPKSHIENTLNDTDPWTEEAGEKLQPILQYLYPLKNDSEWAFHWTQALGQWKKWLTYSLDAVNPTHDTALPKMLSLHGLLMEEGATWLSAPDYDRYSTVLSQKLRSHLRHRVGSLNASDPDYLAKWRQMHGWLQEDWYIACCGADHPLFDLPRQLPKKLRPHPDKREVALHGPGWKLPIPPAALVTGRFPWWIPAVGIPVAGVATWLILSDRSDPMDPLDPSPPFALNDEVNMPCQSEIVVDVVANDMGAGLFISNVQIVPGIDVTIVSATQVRIVAGMAGGFFVEYTVTDSQGRTASATIVILVTDNQPPTIACPPDADVPAGSDSNPGTTGFPTYEDACTPSDQLTIAWSDTQTGGECPRIERLWTVSDTWANTATCLQIVRLADQTPPTIQCPADLVLPVGSDADPTVTGNPSVADNCAAPEDIQVAYTDVVEGEGCSEIIQRTWTATDPAGNVATCSQVITREDTAPPTISCPSNTAANCSTYADTDVTGTATAEDDCTADVPLSFADDPSAFAGCEGVVTRTWTATDQAGNAATCAQTIQVADDEPPVFTLCPEAVTVELGQQDDLDLTGRAEASDECDPSAQVEVAFEDDLSQFGACGGVIARRWTAVDACGNENSDCLQQVTAVNEQPPMIACPPDTLVECGGHLDLDLTGTAQAEDACGNPLEAIWADDPQAIEGCTGVITRTWTTEDPGGQSAACTQQIEWQDTTAPVFTHCPPAVTTPCGDHEDLAVTGQAEAEDACQPEVALTHSDDTGGFSGCEGVILRTFSAEDACGNVTICQQEINVFDNEPPLIVCPGPVTVQCGQQNNLEVTGLATATDHCSDFVEIGHEDNTGGFSGCEGVILRTFFAVDQCGNVSTCQQAIQVNDVPCAFTPLFVVETDQCNRCIGAIDADVGPPGEYIFEWDNGETGPNISGLCQGLYTATITNVDMECTDIYTVEVPHDTGLLLVVLQVTLPSEPSANDGSIILEVPSPGAQLPFHVFLNGINIGNANSNPFQILNLEMGEYVIWIKDQNGNGCYANEVFVLMFPGGKPSPPLLSGPVNVILPPVTLPELPDGWREHPAPPGLAWEMEMHPALIQGQSMLMPVSNRWWLRTEAVRASGPARVMDGERMLASGYFQADRLAMGLQRQFRLTNRLHLFGEGLAGLLHTRALLPGLSLQQERGLAALAGGLQWRLAPNCRLEVSTRFSMIFDEARTHTMWQGGAQLLFTMPDFRENLPKPTSPISAPSFVPKFPPAGISKNGIPISPPSKN